MKVLPTTHQPKKRSKRGLSLVETIVSMGVITIFATGVFGTIFTSSSIHQSSRELEVANLILQGEIENIRGMRWEQIAALEASKTEIEPDAAYTASFGGDYKIIRSLDDSKSDMRTISLTVEWTSVVSKKKNELASTDVYYTKEGMSDSHYKTYF